MTEETTLSFERIREIQANSPELFAFLLQMVVNVFEWTESDVEQAKSAMKQQGL